MVPESAAEPSTVEDHALILEEEDLHHLEEAHGLPLFLEKARQNQCQLGELQLTAG